MGAWAIILAGGSGERFGSGRNKVYETAGGITLLQRSAAAFAASGAVDGIVAVARPGEEDAARACCEAAGLPVITAKGGPTRRASVLAGLDALPEDADTVLIHDGARPLVRPGDIKAAVLAAEEYGAAALAVPVTDTLKKSEGGFITGTVSREGLFAVQTPQAFRTELIKKVHRENVSVQATDDAMLCEMQGIRVAIVPSVRQNIKITYPEDLEIMRALLGREETRAGIGYDVHRLVEGRPLILGGVEIPYEKGLLGHSDADVLTHAVIDAMLGAAGLGDIGEHFPDSDMRYKGISSILLLKEANALLAGNGMHVINIDATVIAERPKIGPYKEKIKNSISEALGIPSDAVNIKGKTTEGLGFTGEGSGMAAEAVCLVGKRG